MSKPTIHWSHPWWLPDSKRAVCLPPFGIWIDKMYKDSKVGDRIVNHELAHWGQWERSRWSYYPLHIYYGLTRPSHRNPLEIEAYKASGVW